MAMMGGLECIAMAVEHLERSERSDTDAPPTRSAGTESPVVSAPAEISPPVREGPVTAHAVPALQVPVPPPPHHCFYQVVGGPIPYPHAHLPPHSSFLHQPRVVTDHHADVGTRALATTAAPTANPGVDIRPHDANHVEEMRRMTYYPQIDVVIDPGAAATTAPAGAAPSSGDISPDDAKHIEELRRLIFQIDLSEWKSLPNPDEREVITKVTDVDVLSGRGGETNHHKGNITFRACVKACQPAYIEAKRREKPYIAQRIVVFIRHLGGRFLKREGESLSADAWKDVGNNKAREKTSQALREGAPELRGDVKEVVSTTTSAPSVAPRAVPYVHEPYYNYGPVPKMVTVTNTQAYDAVLSAGPIWHPQGIQVDLVHRRPAKKQKRRESHYAKAAEDVLSHCPRLSVVSAVSEGSLATLQDPVPSSPVRGTGYPPDAATAPETPRVTISSDEEERSSSSSSHVQHRPATASAPKHFTNAGASASAATAVPSVVVAHSGPRLKLLKKRILSTGS